MANLASAFGGLATGLAQGIQAGQDIAVRKQYMDLQDEQAELQKARSFIDIMRIEDPAVLDFAMSSILPKMGISADSPQYKNFLKLTKAKSESKQAFIEWFAGQAGEGVPVQDIVAGFEDPVGMLSKIIEFQRGKRTEEREETRLGFEEQRLGFEEQRIGIERGRAATSAAAESRLAGAEERRAAAEERRLSLEEGKFRIEGLDTLTKVGRITDEGSRRLMVEKVNEQFGLGMTPEQIDAFTENPAQTLEDLKTEAEVKKLEAETGLIPTTMEQAAADLEQTRAETEKLVKETANIDKELAVSLKKDLLEIQKLDKEIKQMDEISPETQAKIDEIRQKIEESKVDISKKRVEIAREESGLGLTKSETLGYLRARQGGKTLKKMPEYIQEMDPTTAKMTADDLAKTPAQAFLEANQALETKSSRDRLRLNIEDIRVTEELIDRTIDALRRSPEAGGAIGKIVRGVQRVVGVGEDVLDVLANTTEGKVIERDARKVISKDLAFAPSDLRSQIGRIITNPDVSLTEILEVQIALRTAMVSGATSRQLKAQYEDARSQANLSGFMGVEKVVERLGFLQESLKLVREGQEDVLKRGVLPREMAPSADERQQWLLDNGLIEEEEEEE